MNNPSDPLFDYGFYFFNLISVELIRMFAEIAGLQDVYGPADLQGIQGGTFDQASDGVENGRCYDGLHTGREVLNRCFGFSYNKDTFQNRAKR